RKDLGGAGAGAGEIAEMPNLVSLAHGGVPARDHPRVHRRHRGERARVQIEHPMVAEMRVADEKDGHRVPNKRIAAGWTGRRTANSVYMGLWRVAAAAVTGSRIAGRPPRRPAAPELGSGGCGDAYPKSR